MTALPNNKDIASIGEGLTYKEEAHQFVEFYAQGVNETDQECAARRAELLESFGYKLMNTGFVTNSAMEPLFHILEARTKYGLTGDDNQYRDFSDNITVTTTHSSVVTLDQAIASIRERGDFDGPAAVDWPHNCSVDVSGKPTYGPGDFTTGYHSDSDSD